MDEIEGTQKLFWSLKNIPRGTTTETYVGNIDSILKCNFNCINWSSARFESAYIEFKRQPMESTDDDVRHCEIKLFLKFWQYPIIAFR